jgi:hypothetical protein
MGSNKPMSIVHNPWIGKPDSGPIKTKMTHKRCALPGCRKYLSMLCVKFNDPYCSRGCAEIAHGTVGQLSWLSNERRKIRESITHPIGHRS